MPGGGGAGRLVAVPAPGTEGPRPALPPGLRPHARVRWAQSLWSRVCAGHLRDFRAPGPPNLATGALAALRAWSPACPAPTVPPGFCFPPSQQFPSASPRCTCGSLSPPAWGQARPGRAGAQGACADRRGPGQGWGQALGLWAPSPALPHLVVRSPKLSRDGLPGQRGRPAGRGERGGERHRGRGPRGREEWALGASSPLKPPGPSRPVRGPRWSSPGRPHREAGGAAGTLANPGPVRSLAGGVCSSVTGPSAQTSRHSGLRARRGGPAP